MTTTTATTYGSKFSQQEQADGIYGWLNGGGYTTAQTNALAGTLLAELRDEVDQRLPEGVTWQPATSEFLLPCDDSGQPLVESPTLVEMETLFDLAWASVEARYEEIEKAVLDA